MKSGKLDSDLLKKIVFEHITYQRPEVLVRPGIGEDCAVMDFGDYECVVSTDPITGAIEEIGRLAVHISCNDVASNGIQPVGLLLAVMLPEDTTEQQIEEIMKQAGEAAAMLEVEIIGGHTEITAAVKQPIVVSTAIGRAPKGMSQKAEDMRPGDYILLTKEAGLEGTGVICCDCADRLRSFLSEEEIREGAALLDRVNVVKEGVTAGRIGTAGMHDVTEGGILGAVWEMCHISNLGAELWLDAIPVAELTKKICAHFDLNWLRLISSGCMMIMAHPEQKDALLQAIREQGVPVTCIGQIQEKEKGIHLIVNGRAEEITPPVSDELYKVVF